MGYNKRVKGHYTDGKTNHEIDVPVFIFQDENCWIFYSPGLDISGYGYTQEEAEKSFITTIDEFVRYTVNKKTTLQVLHDLGWSFTRTNKKIKALKAPPIHEVLGRDEYLQQIFTEKDFYKQNRKVELALA